MKTLRYSVATLGGLLLFVAGFFQMRYDWDVPFDPLAGFGGCLVWIAVDLGRRKQDE